MKFEEYLRYEPETGRMYWIQKTSPKSRLEIGMEAGSRNTVGRYIVVRLFGVNYLFHRMAWYLHYGEWPKGQIDHINRNTFDNRIENLKDVDHRTNNQNKENFNGGASFHKKSGKWYAQIQVDKKKKHLGSFNTKEEAQQAYKDFPL